MGVLDPALVAAAGLAALAVFGALIGSFLNVVIWRVPRGESVVTPPSACPACGHTIRTRDNIPVVSWLILRARCRDCGAPIPVRYPLVEAGTAALFLLVALRLGWTWALPAYLYLAALGVALALIDIEVHRLPNVLVLPATPVLALLLAAASWGEGDWPALLRAAIGAVLLWAVYYVLMKVRPGGMGFGDVKLAPVLGMAMAWLGWGTLVVGGFAAFLLGGLFGLFLIWRQRAGMKTRVPFGPWMVLGAGLGIAIGEQVWGSYLAILQL